LKRTSSLGLSSAIIGSGMAFRYDYFKTLMSTVTAVGGFDKEIELKMLKKVVRSFILMMLLFMMKKIQKRVLETNADDSRHNYIISKKILEVLLKT
jgi:hypothetical protein